jgi:chemotaxis signal transduction protein
VSSVAAVYVRLHGERYAIDVVDVIEVDQRDEVTPVWGASPLIVGVRNLRGAVLPVLDLGAALGLPSQADAPYIVVVESGSATAGLGVDDVIDIGPLPWDLQPADQPGLRGRALEGDGLIGVIDVEAILAMAAAA